jgi:D-alanine transaminase
MIVYLNGEYLPQEQAKISPMDRGFLFGEGIYEAIPFYKGKPFAMDEHWQRFQNGLSFLRMDHFEENNQKTMLTIFESLLSQNGLDQTMRVMIYLQVTRGAPATRSHVFYSNYNSGNNSGSNGLQPTIFAYCSEILYPSPDQWERGLTAALVPDQRWGRVDIKTVNLLPNVLSAEAAKDQGADEAILVLESKDQTRIITEGSHNNVMAYLKDGTIVTHPLSHNILPGITRHIVLQVARAVGLEVEERPMTVQELLEDAQEVFTTSTTSEIKPIVSIDGKPVGNGVAGAITKRLLSLLRARIEQETGVVVES